MKDPTIKSLFPRSSGSPTPQRHENNIENPSYASGQTSIFTGDDGGTTYSFSRKDGGGDGVITYDWATNNDATVIAVCVNAEPAAAGGSGSLRRRF